MSTRVKDVLFLVALFVAAYFFATSLRSDSVKDIRSDLNDLGQQLCENGKKANTVGHYNTAIKALIVDLQKRREQNIATGHTDYARINSETIGALQSALIPVSEPDCSKPLLP